VKNPGGLGHIRTNSGNSSNSSNISNKNSNNNSSNLPPINRSNPAVKNTSNRSFTN